MKTDEQVRIEKALFQVSLKQQELDLLKEEHAENIRCLREEIATLKAARANPPRVEGDGHAREHLRKVLSWAEAMYGRWVRGADKIEQTNWTVIEAARKFLSTPQPAPEERNQKDALRVYGRHLDSCCCNIGHENYAYCCDCGFDEALAQSPTGPTRELVKWARDAEILLSSYNTASDWTPEDQAKLDRFSKALAPFTDKGEP